METPLTFAEVLAIALNDMRHTANMEALRALGTSEMKQKLDMAKAVADLANIVSAT